MTPRATDVYYEIINQEAYECTKASCDILSHPHLQNTVRNWPFKLQDIQISWEAWEKYIYGIV